MSQSAVVPEQVCLQ